MISTSERTRFARDDTPHRLGDIAANLARIETFALRPYHTKAVRDVINQTRWFVEWAARNVPVDDAAQLVELQRLITGWAREDVWDNVQPNQPRRSDIAHTAAFWSQRVLQMSGLIDASQAIDHQTEVVIPPNHKFAIIALGDVWHRVDTVRTRAGVFTRIPPVHPGDHWKQWMGELWYDAFNKAGQYGLYLVVVRPSDAPDAQNAEDRDVARACKFLRRGLAIATSYFKSAVGTMVVGAHGRLGCDVNSTDRVPSLPHSPDSKSIQLTESDMRRAALFAGVLRDVGSESRLARAVACFMRGMESGSASQRLHEFVRCIDGIIHPRVGHSRMDFVSAVSSVTLGVQDGVLDQIYRLRGAEEHLHDPLDRIDEPSVKHREGVLFERAGQAEAVARHMLSRVLEVDDLRRIHGVDATAETYWRNPNRRLWGMPLDLKSVVLR